MRIGALQGRAVLLRDDRAVDIERASDGRFPASTRGVLEQWGAFTAWAATVDASAGEAFAVGDLDAPVTDPRQIFAIGLNYRDHAEEANLEPPKHIVVFTKFASSLAGPEATIALSGDKVDYEAELVVVIGDGGHRIPEAKAWSHVAGLSVGQDISDRAVQLRGPAPQFSLGKSYPGYSPFGPAIVTLDELGDPEALRIGATLEGPEPGESIVLQDGTTADLIFSVPRLIADLSEVVTLYPGDLIFTGTPAGVGGPKGLFLRAGQTLVTTIEGLGTLRNELH